MKRILLTAAIATLGLGGYAFAQSHAQTGHESAAEADEADEADEAEDSAALAARPPFRSPVPRRSRWRPGRAR